MICKIGKTSMNKIQPTIFLFLTLLLPQLSFSQTKPMREETKALVKSNNEFAFKAYAEMSKTDGNIFFSPFSLSAALAMVLGGAKGATADQIAAVLQLSPNQKNLHGEYALLLNQLATNDKQTQLAIANALWGQKGLAILPTYQDLLRTNYKSELQTVDFVANPQTAAATINAWAEQNTNGRIKNLFQANSFKPDSLLVLANAVYFHAQWKNEFSEYGTEPADFWLDKSQKISTPMMNQTDHFPYINDASLQAIELPYGDGKYSMIVLLPKERDGIAGLEKKLSSDFLEKYITGLAQQEVNLFLPKFEFDANLSLNEFLSNLGMPLAFQDAADFSGISNDPRGVKLNSAIQKTFLKVNEKETEAAAVSAMGGVAGGVARFTSPPPPPPIFRADHPFLFLIRETATNSILFLGRVTNPSNKTIDFKMEATSAANAQSAPKKFVNEADQPKAGFNKTWLALVGILVMVAGLIIFRKKIFG
jgi:serpin B